VLHLPLLVFVRMDYAPSTRIQVSTPQASTVSLPNKVKQKMRRNRATRGTYAAGKTTPMSAHSWTSICTSSQEVIRAMNKLTALLGGFIWDSRSCLPPGTNVWSRGTNPEALRIKNPPPYISRPFFFRWGNLDTYIDYGNPETPTILSRTEDHLREEKLLLLKKLPERCTLAGTYELWQPENMLPPE